MEVTALSVLKGTYTTTTLGIKVVRWVEKYPFLHKRWAEFRSRLYLGLLQRYHSDAIHSMRDLALWVDTLKATGELLQHNERVHTNQFCNAASRVMSNIIGCDDEPVHCSLKIYVQRDKDAEIVTIGRSQPSHRLAEFGTEYAHKAKLNTVFSSMLGLSDDHRSWSPIVSSFACNDLISNKSQFSCDRKGWEAIYNSTMAFPLRYQRSGDEWFTFVGFLTFDRPHKNGFPGVPDVYDCLNDLSGYERLCRISSTWNLGACLSDALCVTLLPLLRVERTGE